MKRVTQLVLLLVLLALAGPASAYTCDPVTNTCTPTWKWNEPTTYVPVPPATTGAPLTDLKDGVITWTIPGQTGTITKPASSPAGGGVGVTASGPVPVAACTKVTMASSMVERTVAGGASASVASNTLLLDRTVLLGPGNVPTATPDPACFKPNPATGLTAE